MSLISRILIALIAGLGSGILMSRFGGGNLGVDVVAIAAPVGKAWLNALQMPLVPLIFGLLVNGVASAAMSVRSGGIAAATLVLFTVLLFASAAFSAFLMPLLLELWPVPAGASAMIVDGGSTSGPESAMPSAEWLLAFLPANPVAAAAEGQMVAVVVFSLLFGFAATRIEAEPRRRLLGLVSAMVDTLLVIVGWVLRCAPVGVFALAFVAGSRSGLATAGALVHYVALVVATCVSVTILVYPLVASLGRISLPRFARAALPAQLIAFSTQSSIASLPAMIEASDGGIEARPEVRSIILPLAVSLFRITSPAANLGVAIYVASLSNIDLTVWQVAIGVAVAAVVSLAAVGLPSQVSFYTTIGPISLAMGVPIEVLPLLLAVETVPDIFRTVGNVTADLAAVRIIDRSRVASMIGRGEREPPG